MVRYFNVQHHIDKGRGKAAEKLGQPFNGYRLTGTSSGDFPAAWSQVSLNFNLFRRRFQETKLELGVKNAALFYEIIANMEPYLLGDIFIQNDPNYVAGRSYGAGATLLYNTLQFDGMAFAWHPPVNKSIGARIDRLAWIYRSSTTPRGFADGGQMWETTLDFDRPLVLSNGRYSFAPPGSAQGSLVPVGLLMQIRSGDAIFASTPPSAKPARWNAYVPPLPGYEPAEGDAIVTQDGARYLIEGSFNQEAGVVGNQMTVQRKISQV